jgi:hypothetical protein
MKRGVDDYVRRTEEGNQSEGRNGRGSLARGTHKLVRVSRADFHKFANSQKLCSTRYVWKVMRKLVDLGYVHVFTAKGEKGYGLAVDAIKRHKVAASRYEKFMGPLRKGAT